MSWSVGIMTFPTEWENKIHVPNQQPVILMFAGSSIPRDSHISWHPSLKTTGVKSQDFACNNHLVILSAYPLVNVNKKLWNITIFHGKTHYFYGHSQCRKLWLFTRGYGYMYHKCTIISYYKPSLSLYSGTIFQRVQIARGGRVPCRSP